MTACPVHRLGVEMESCQKTECRYHIQGNCEFQACQSVMAEDNRERRLHQTAELYGISVQEVQSKARDVMIAILLNGFFEHVHGKPLIDCKKSELDLLRNSEAEFNAWRKKPNPKFADCMRVLDIIETNL